MAEKQIDFKEIINALDADVFDKKLIQDNKLHFMFDEKLYRVRMPMQKELAQATNIYHSEKNRLLQNGNVFTEAKLKEILKKNDIDVYEMEAKLKELDNELIQVSISLAHKKDNEEKAIDTVRDNLNRIKNERYKLAEAIAENLSSSLETQAKNKQYEYLTAMCTETYIADDKTGKWEKTWNTFSDYENNDTNLVYIALGYLTRLILTS